MAQFHFSWRWSLQQMLPETIQHAFGDSGSTMTPQCFGPAYDVWVPHHQNDKQFPKYGANFSHLNEAKRR